MSWSASKLFPINPLEILLAIMAGITVTVVPPPLVLCSAVLLVAPLGWRLYARSHISEASSSLLNNLGRVNLVVAILLSTFTGIRVGGAMTMADVAFVVAAVCLLFARVADPRRWSPVPLWLYASTGLLAFTGATASLTSSDPIPDLIVTAQFAVTMFMVPTLLTQLADAPGPLRMAAWAFILSATFNAAIGLLEFLGGADFAYRIINLTPGQRAPGLTTHPNQLGRVCFMALALAVVMKTSSTRGRVFRLGAIGLLGSGILASGSRVALVAGLVAIILPGLVSKRFSASVIVASLLTLSLAFVLGSVLGEETGLDLGFRRLIEEEEVRQSDETRLVLYEEAVEDWTERPLVGHGLRDVRGFHSIFLQLLQSGGLLGLTSFLVFSFGVFATARRVISGRTDEMMAIGLGAAVACFLWFVSGLVLPAIFDRYLYIPVGLLIAARAIQRRAGGEGAKLAS